MHYVTTTQVQLDISKEIKIYQLLSSFAGNPYQKSCSI